MKFNQIIQHIENKGIMPGKDRVPKRLTLGPIKTALKTLNIKPPLNGKKVILIAGTNGKGSVAKTLETLLVSLGFNVGLYTSPHLVCTLERISINGKSINKKLFAKTFEEVKKVTKNLTHFEILTLMATQIFFKTKKVDWAIFEIGLGGTKDATNAIPHKTSIITTLGHDHEHILGNSLERIAKNKFGIIKKHNLVVSTKLPKELKELQTKICKQKKCNWKTIDNFHHKTTVKNFKLKTSLIMYNKKCLLKLHSKRGAINTALALTAFKQLGFNPATHMNSLKNVNWPARMSELKIKSPCKIYLSGDHNEQGIRSLIEILKKFPYKNLYIILSIGKTKDPNKILPILLNLQNSHIFLTTAKFMGREKEDYKKHLNKLKYFKNPITALNKTRKIAKKNDLIIVTGSLYLIGDILEKYRSSMRKL